MPRRRRYRRGGGGDACCGCCTYWHNEAENIAAENIKARAKSSMLSKLVCCDSLRCFERHNVNRLYIAAGIACGILLVATMSYASGVYRPALYTENFKETACRVERLVYSRNLTSHCEWSKGRSRGTHHYKCLRIYVTYRLKDEESTNRNVTSYSTIYYESYGEMMNQKYPQVCTKHPRNCDRNSDVEGPIEVYYKHFKNYIKDSPFECYYNPDKPKEVIGTEEADVGRARGILTILAICFSVVTLLLIFMCCTCGCKNICCTGSVIPQDIQQEMSKRGIDIQGLTQGVPIGGHGPVVYVGSAVQVVPNVPGAVQPQPAPAQPLPMQPGQPPVGPQYGQYPPPGNYPPGSYPPGNYPAPQPGYPAPQQPAYPPPQPGYQPPPPGQYPPAGQYPPPQPGAYPPQGGYPAPQPGAYPPGAYAPPPQQAPPPQPDSGEKPPVGNYQPPTYAGLNKEASPLPEKPPVE